MEFQLSSADGRTTSIMYDAESVGQLRTMDGIVDDLAGHINQLGNQLGNRIVTNYWDKPDQPWVYPPYVYPQPLTYIETTRSGTVDPIPNPKPKMHNLEIAVFRVWRNKKGHVQEIEFISEHWVNQRDGVSDQATFIQLSREEDLIDIPSNQLEFRILRRETFQ